MDATIFLILGCALGAFVLSLLIGRGLIPALHALKAGQSIREVGPKWHSVKAGTPTMGGIMFITAAAVCTLAGCWRMMRTEGEYTHLYVLAIALAYGLIGFADDFVKVKFKRNLGLTALQKLVLQLAIAVGYLMILWRSGDLSCDLYIPFVGVELTIPTVWYMIFAAFVIVGCVNAVNLTDGVDGLAAGVTVPVMVFFAVSAWCVYGRPALSVFSASLTGALAGFLCYNFHPAKVFMGDTGSLFLGGAVCGMAFALDMPLVLVLVGIVYICETLSVIMQVLYFKLTHGKRIFKMTPIHHHFEMSGWKEEKIVCVFAGLTALFCVLAYLGIMDRL